MVQVRVRVHGLAEGRRQKVGRRTRVCTQAIIPSESPANLKSSSKKFTFPFHRLRNASRYFINAPVHAAWSLPTLSKANSFCLSRLQISNNNQSRCRRRLLATCVHFSASSSAELRHNRYFHLSFGAPSTTFMVASYDPARHAFLLKPATRRPDSSQDSRHAAISFLSFPCFVDRDHRYRLMTRQAEGRSHALRALLEDLSRRSL